jgi:hypothetical protein
MAGDHWQSIEDDREKYAAYLCSREWAVKREAVRERSGGKCERCHVLPMDHVHHLTYERKYREELEDLQASCKPCHEFTHGKSDFDPCSDAPEVKYLRSCVWRSFGGPPVPPECFEIGPSAMLLAAVAILDNIATVERLTREIDASPCDANVLCMDAMYAVEGLAGCNVVDLPPTYEGFCGELYRMAMEVFGLTASRDARLWIDNKEAPDA